MDTNAILSSLATWIVRGEVETFCHYGSIMNNHVKNVQVQEGSRGTKEVSFFGFTSRFMLPHQRLCLHVQNKSKRGQKPRVLLSIFHNEMIKTDEAHNCLLFPHVLAIKSKMRI